MGLFRKVFTKLKRPNNSFYLLKIFCKNDKEQGVVDDGVYPRCSGYHKRGICVYGIGDVGWVSKISVLLKA